MLTTDTPATAVHVNARSRFEALALLAAVVAMIGVLLLPRPETLPVAGHRMAALSIAILILWATEALPIAVTALVAVVLQPVLGLATPAVAFRNFMSPVFFFAIAMFIIAFGWMKSGLARRFALWLISRAGTDAKRVVYVFMFGTAAVSTVISDVPVAAIFMTIALGMLRKLQVVPGASNLGKALMIGIPVAALIGGVGTPAGAATNVLGLFLIEQNGGPRITFLQWTAIGLPIVVVLLPIAAWVMTKFYPPEVSSIGDVSEIEEERRGLRTMRADEWKVIAIMVAMITLWISSTWVPAFDTVLVALAGACAMFLPGMRLFSWKEVQGMTGWDAVMVIGGVTSLGAAATESGLARWVVESSFGGLQSWDAIWIIALISLFTVFIHLLIPINPVINAVLIPPIMVLAAASGQSPALYALPVAFMASAAFLLPLDAVPLVTYTQGYYKMFDMMAPGIVLAIVWTIFMTASLLLIGPLVGVV